MLKTGLYISLVGSFMQRVGSLMQRVKYVDDVAVLCLFDLP